MNHVHWENWRGELKLEKKINKIKLKTRKPLWKLHCLLFTQYYDNVMLYLIRVYCIIGLISLSLKNRYNKWRKSQYVYTLCKQANKKNCRWKWVSIVVIFSLQLSFIQLKDVIFYFFLNKVIKVDLLPCGKNFVKICLNPSIVSIPRLLIRENVASINSFVWQILIRW